MTIAAACWLCAVETTRAIKVDEPGSTGTLKFAIITDPLGLAIAWADAAVAELEKQPAASKKSTVKSKTKIDARRIFLFIFGKSIYSWLFGKLPISFGMDLVVRCLRSLLAEGEFASSFSLPKIR
jgi:hypothetical protein